MSQRSWVRRVWLILGGLSVAVLAAAIFTLGSLNAPVRPQDVHDFVILFSLTVLIVIIFIVFALILTRNVVRMLGERRAGLLGSRFKTKMVLGAMGVSLLPIVFLFFFSYALVNRTMNIWFPEPLKMASSQSQALVQEMGKKERARLDSLARDVTDWLSQGGRNHDLKHYKPRPDLEFEIVWLTDSMGKEFANVPTMPPTTVFQDLHREPNGDDVWEIGGKPYLAGRAPYRGGWLMVGRALPGDFVSSLDSIHTETQNYAAQYQHLRLYKNELLLSLLLITLLLLFATTWVALFLSKRVTVPIQALAKATQQVARGNLEYRISSRAHDELGALVDSFNHMAGQLGESRKQIDDFTQNLQQALEEIERRRKLIETILESIPTGVLSIDADGGITRVNPAAKALFGERAGSSGQSLPSLLGKQAARRILHLMRRAVRMGLASEELEIASEGRLRHAAVTVSALGSGSANSGFIVVIDDVTELLRAQKAAAWQEVAQRIAHEIKNPLTPIQLSAQRLLRHIERSSPGRRREDRSDWPALVAECAGLIEREVQTLESLVNEFSQFARFPSARLEPADANEIVTGALRVFHGRLEDISIEQNLASGLPLVKADAELLRRVIVNIIDNAAEALEGAKLRVITVSTRAASPGDAVEIEVADTGHGISPEDKDRLFLPHFSTKERGTGLGLAIASRIISEHNGSLSVEDNRPSGARFLIRLPAAEVPASEVPAPELPAIDPSASS